MKYFNKTTGKIGEGLALKYLLSKNYELLTMNYRTKFGEIDLIMTYNGVVVFVEVKTKKQSNFGTPEDMFTPAKRQRVKNMGIVYLHGKDVPCRIDMIAVDMSVDPAIIRHYENVTFL